MRRSTFVLLLCVLLSGCGGDEGNATFTVRESVEQLHITHAPPGEVLEVIDDHGVVVQSGTVDTLGSLMFRTLTPGDGYRVRTTTIDPPERTGDLTVMSVEESLPDDGFYRDQVLVPGFQYIVTRDGTTLSAYVTFPDRIQDGPFATVVSYSGYAPSQPGKPINDGAFTAFCNDIAAFCDAPNDPAALLAAVNGFATVNVNMRGTGCSGGAYDYFETLQLLDGYDVIEVVARQDWVLHNKVGMVGLSYPGISQLFVAAQRPPGLAAITPLSVIGNSATTMLPGGILNDGFALSWVTNVLSRAQPYGQGWEQAQVDAGDTMCAENQLLHGQMVDNVEQARSVSYYDPAQHDRYNPTSFVDRIEVPVFLSSAFQDEQTGPYFFTLLDRFTSSPARRLNVYNGVHIDAFQPGLLQEWRSFLELFVAERVPTDDALVQSLSPFLFMEVFGTSSVTLPPTRWGGYATVEEARAAWLAEPPLHAVFESGAYASEPGAPVPGFERYFASWPPPETQAQRWYFRDGGTLTAEVPTEINSASTFALDPDAGDRGILAPGGNVWDKLPTYDWRQPAAGSAVVFVSDPLVADEVMLGTGSVDLWIQSPVVDDADLEVNLSEVREDGQEMYVQSGWLRASLRAPGPDATALWPSPSYTEAVAAPLVPGQWTQVRVGIAGFSHVFRANSRIRISVDTPGDSRAEWRFALKTFPSAVTYVVGHDAAHPSSVVLPFLNGVASGSALPPCPGPRGQQCRTYVQYDNTSAP